MLRFILIKRLKISGHTRSRDTASVLWELHPVMHLCCPVILGSLIKNITVAGIMTCTVCHGDMYVARTVGCYSVPTCIRHCYLAQGESQTEESSSLIHLNAESSVSVGEQKDHHRARILLTRHTPYQSQVLLGTVLVILHGLFMSVKGHLPTPQKW